MGIESAAPRPAPSPESRRPGDRRHPLRPDIGVLALVPDAWSTVAWTTRHHVVSRLGRYFPVVWVDPPSEWRAHWLESASPPESVRDAKPGLDVYRSGRFLPRLYRPRPIASLLERLRLRRAAAMLRERGARRIVLYVWRAELGDALDRIGHDAAVYHIDDEYTFSPVEKPLDEREARLIRRVDEVIVHSPALLEKKGRLNPNTRMIPNGVDFAALVTSRSEPSDLAGIPRPRVGYVGVIKEQLDLPLLATLAERHPDWHFVLVGPNQARPAAMTRLNARPNVHLLGAKPVTDVPAYLQHMDVGIMPYVLDGYTKFIYPLKLHEYFASGLPVVATPVRSVLAFRGLVTLAEGEPAWSAALADALAGKHGGPADVAARRSVAAAHDWDDLVLQIANTLCESLGQPSFGLR